ncbi:MAG: sigma-54-dependent Fis family transcriptional regulator [bacterium]|nr:sigma-54-dependent Fis family transcriptional regulator [bacterium]
MIDDEPVLQDVLGTLLRSNGFECHIASNAAEGLETLRETEVDLVLLDVMLPDRSGLDVLPEIKIHDPNLPVVIITAYSSVESAIQAMQHGAFHYVPKPFNNEEVLHVIRQACERRRLLVENLQLRSRLEGLGEIVGTSRRMQEVFELIHRAAPARSNILIVGESGTGKELVAQAIHRMSPRRERPFVPIHTSAIPSELLESTLFGHVKGAFTGAVNSSKGLFEASHQGTLFLDEVGTVNMETQTKLLRVIQEREFRRVGGVEPIVVDVRLVSATNVDLWQEVQQGRFREDLYYRLNVISVDLPPLRDRTADIPLLATHFLRHYAEENDRQIEGFTTRAMDTLSLYRWPGNVRELENVVERAVVLCRDDLIDVSEFPPALRQEPGSVEIPRELPEDGLDFRKTVAEFQSHLIREALSRADGVQRRAAKLLALSPTTLNEMVHRLGIRDDQEDS